MLMLDNFLSWKWAREYLFRIRMEHTPTSGIDLEWYWRIMEMTSTALKLMAPDVLQRETEDTSVVVLCLKDFL
jgi:hypothetical protein